jgi:hypothetical protein
MLRRARGTLTLVRPAARVTKPEAQPIARRKRPDVDIQKRTWLLPQPSRQENWPSERRVATTDFKSLNLSRQLLDALSEMKIQQATEIQAKTIPALLQGRDVVFASHTGSGKTLTYVPFVACRATRLVTTIRSGRYLLPIVQLLREYEQCVPPVPVATFPCPLANSQPRLNASASAATLYRIMHSGGTHRPLRNGHGQWSLSRRANSFRKRWQSPR